MIGPRVPRSQVEFAPVRPAETEAALWTVGKNQVCSPGELRSRRTKFEEISAPPLPECQPNMGGRGASAPEKPSHAPVLRCLRENQVRAMLPGMARRVLQVIRTGDGKSRAGFARHGQPRI